MTLHIRAPRPTDAMREEARHIPDVRAVADQLGEIYTAAGSRETIVNFEVDEAVTEDGERVEQVRFIVTGRYVKDGTKYLVGDGIVLDFSSVLELFEELAA